MPRDSGSRNAGGGNGDIRQYISPQQPNVAQRPRNRRIITSDSDENADLQPVLLHQNQNNQAREPQAQQQLQPLNANNNENANPNVPIQISDSESDSSDSMYIPARRPPSTQDPIEWYHRPQQRRQRRSSPNRQQRQQPATPQRHQQTADRPQRHATPQRDLRVIAEAESTSEEESDDSPDESNEDAAALYRSAILGVRNRPTAALQVHATYSTRFI